MTIRISPGRALAVAALVAAPSLARAAPWTSGKNYLVIIMDDVAVDKVGSYAGDFPGYTPTYLPSTPTIDQLASRGLRFTRAWATPLCSPTRAAFQSGQQPFRTGIGTVLENGAPDLDTTRFGTIASSFAAQGYTTGFFGKYHIGRRDANGVVGPPTTPTFTVPPHPALAGWDRFFGSYDGMLGTAPGLGYFRWNRMGWFKGGNGTTGVETTHATKRTEDIALGWINTRTQPWLAVVAFNAAHSGTTAGTAWGYGDVTSPTYTVQTRSAALACLTTSTCANPTAQAYQALVEDADLKLETLLNGMDPAVLDNTVIVLFGDNGTPGSNNGTATAVQESVFNVVGRGKDTVYENGIRVPLIVADGVAWRTGVPGPTIPVIDRRIVAKVNTLDIYNTLFTDAFMMSLANLDSMPFNDCFTVNDIYCGFPGKRYGYTESFPSNASPAGAKVAVSYGEDTMVACYKGAPYNCLKEAFYDTSTDPLETTPLAWTGIRADRLRDYFTNLHTANPQTSWAHTVLANPVVGFCAAAVPACP